MPHERSTIPLDDVLRAANEQARLDKALLDDILDRYNLKLPNK
jgi:hypothetical protein